MKQHYILENTYLEKEDYEALKRYCSENLKFLDKKDFISNSGNLYIDSVVNYKADMAEKAGRSEFKRRSGNHADYTG